MVSKLFPKDAYKIPEIQSLKAPNNIKKPIQFWQLYEVLGQDPIVGILSNFYKRVFADDKWFQTPFAQVAASTTT